MNNTTCDKCHKDFNIKVKKKKNIKQIEVSYFICPHCKEKYIIAVIDSDCRKLQRDIKTQQSKISFAAQQFINREINENEYKQTIDDIHDEMDRLKYILKEYSDILKQEAST